MKTLDSRLPAVASPGMPAWQAMADTSRERLEIFVCHIYRNSL